MQGKCLCGAVEFEIDAEKAMLVNCHCNLCRSHTGAAFSTYATVKHSELEINRGQDNIRSFGGDKGVKHFCGVCGTPLYNLNPKYPGMCMVYFGTLEGANALQPKVNVWCDSKLAWVDEVASIRSRSRGLGER